MDFDICKMKIIKVGCVLIHERKGGLFTSKSFKQRQKRQKIEEYTDQNVQACFL